MSKTNFLEVPFIEGLEDMTYSELDMALETGGAKGYVGTNNWPGDFPYTPDCVFAIARSRTHMAILYHVRGLDLRAVALEDNGRVWEDSCCEFFVSDPTTGEYYNFELNCIGTLLGGKGPVREGRVRRSPEELSKVKRFSTLGRKAHDLSGKIFGWSAGMIIPFELFGVDPDNLPATLKANFYKCGDKTAHPHFLSWNPVECPKPDFHKPEFFGELKLN